MVTRAASPEDGGRALVRMPAQVPVVEVLAAHARSDWSDHTYACVGCYRRYQQRIDSGDLQLTDEVRSELHRLAKPDWTLADYHAHVAHELAIAQHDHGTAAATPGAANGGGLSTAEMGELALACHLAYCPDHDEDCFVSPADLRLAEELAPAVARIKTCGPQTTTPVRLTEAQQEALAATAGTAIASDGLVTLVESMVTDARANSWDECVTEAHDAGWVHDYARDDLTARNPYRADPTSEDPR